MRVESEFRTARPVISLATEDESGDNHLRCRVPCRSRRLPPDRPVERTPARSRQLPMCGISAQSGPIPKRRERRAACGHDEPDCPSRSGRQWNLPGSARRPGLSAAGDRRSGGGHRAALQRRRHGLDGLQRRVSYNFPALRHRLEARGHSLRSKGDTEVLVHLYEDEGTEMFALLRGMFALAIWDALRRLLILARDRMGQKPILYRGWVSPVLRQRTEGPAGIAGKHDPPPGRPSGRGPVPDLRLRAPSPHHSRRGM